MEAFGGMRDGASQQVNKRRSKNIYIQIEVGWEVTDLVLEKRFLLLPLRKSCLGCGICFLTLFWPTFRPIDWLTMFGPCFTTSRIIRGHYDTVLAGTGSKFWPTFWPTDHLTIYGPCIRILRITGHYDTVVVGAGSAGSVLTNRLTEDPDRRQNGPIFFKNIDHPSVQASLTGGWAKRHLIWFQACRLEDPHACCPNVQPQQVTSRVVDL